LIVAKNKKQARQKKHRVAFKKNREKRSRKNDLTREVFQERILETGDTDALTSGERLSGKGSLTRYRTVVGVESEDGDEILRDIDENCLQGRVLAATGLNSIVQTEAGVKYECTVRRVVRTLARDARNVVVTGDRVWFLPTDQVLKSGFQQGVIERVEGRAGIISRVSQNREHIIVANVDQVIIVASAADPALKPHLIDRFLVSAEKGEVHAIVCINKTDLIDLADLQPMMGLYARLGYPVIATSGLTGRGIPALRRLLAGKQSVFAGQSGVGKSSLLNALKPGLNIKTAQVSDWTRKGRHTTRRAILHDLDFGGWVVDTPGIRQFALWDVIPEEVEGHFIEFRPFVAYCKFADCTHEHEEGCGIKHAVAQGLIFASRYESYLRILHDDFS
jgi:ribosome biogenesis GTPase / thiamine phosphate phosphatase